MSEDTLNPYRACTLSHLAVVQIAGADAANFLQGQLTQDIRAVSEDALIPAGYCSPKGRLLAVLRLTKKDGNFLAILPKAGLEALLKRLRMYVMRSEVTLTLREDLSAVGFVGRAPETFEGAPVYPLSSPADRTRVAAALPEGRALAVVAKDKAPTDTDSALFELSCIAAGEPVIYEATRDAFVPQWVNLECLGGVSFSKGCYTGQEIVSRVEHIGKTPRRTALFALTGEREAAPGSDVFQNGNPAGVVVDAASALGRTLLLVQTEVALLSSRSLTLGDGTQLTPLPLPYPYERAK